MKRETLYITQLEFSNARKPSVIFIMDLSELPLVLFRDIIIQAALQGTLIEALSLRLGYHIDEFDTQVTKTIARLRLEHVVSAPRRSPSPSTSFDAGKILPGFGLRLAVERLASGSRARTELATTIHAVVDDLMSRLAQCKKSLAMNEVLEAVCRTALSNIETENMLRCLLIDDYYNSQMLPYDWGADEESRIDISQCSLLVAISARYIDVQQSMLPGITNINFETRYFGSLLQTACHAGHCDTVKLLLDQGADIHHELRLRAMKKPAIHVASASGHRNVVELLLEPRYNLDTSAREFRLAAVAALPKSSETALRLFEKYTGPGVKQIRRDLCWAAADYGRTELMLKMLDAGAPLDSDPESSPGWAPLRWACRSGHCDTVRALLARGAATTICPRRRLYAFHYAIRWKHFDVADILLVHGDNINDDCKGYREFVDAARGGQLDIAQYLIGRGLDVHSPSVESFRNQSMEEAASYGRVQFLRWLICDLKLNVGGGRLPRNTSSLMTAALHAGNPEVVHFLFQLGAGPIDLSRLKKDYRAYCPYVHSVSKSPGFRVALQVYSIWVDTVLA
ncbi:ankyrin [Lophium mytilinum]|uniref:Ankyrin n=1 Tax=Lophium mytilinum TaxID=390894 RepID=A0A6A6R582_9PEZI|nr:ankyrin [Lophium mytilinum]